MKYYSQYGEDRIISEFIQHRNHGNFLDIGANDGITISNSLHFIELGWGSTLIEASPISFEKLSKLHLDNPKVQSLNICLSDKSEKFTFYHNLTHLHNGDSDLLSTISEKSYLDSQRSGFEFEKFEIECYPFEYCEKKLKYEKYDIISIDIEGYDYSILSQMNLEKLGCEILIIEYNDDLYIKNKIIEYTSQFNLINVLYDNNTNIILTK